MTLKEQLKTVKQNWLLALVLLILILLPLFGTTTFREATRGYSESLDYGAPTLEMAKSSASYGGIAPYYQQDNFAPEEQDRLITKTASLSSEVERGTFFEAEAKLKAIVTGTNSYLLNQNTNKYGTEGWQSYSGSYQIKVDSQKYDAIVLQLKEIGEVQSFDENAEDITGQQKDIQVELDAEKDRLVRYQNMLAEATSTSEKIDLSDRIFNQERTIKYLEDALSNVENKVAYSTLYVNINEKQSGYARVVLVKFSELIRRLVESFNSLLSLLFWVLPYAVVVALVWLGVRWVRNR